MRAKPGHYPVGHWRLVAYVAAQDQVPAANSAQHVPDRHDLDTIGGGVQFDGSQCHRIDLRCLDRCRSGDGAGNPSDTAAGGEIQHAPAGNRRGMVQDMPRESEPAGPGKRPERRRHIAFGEPGLGRLPDRRDLGREVQPHLRHIGRRGKDRVRAHERLGVARAGPSRLKPSPAVSPARPPARPPGWRGTAANNRLGRQCPGGSPVAPGGPPAGPEPGRTMPRGAASQPARANATIAAA